MIKNGTITEFIDWKDTDGNIINASDGGILYAEGAYHWYGMALRDLPFQGGGKGGQTTTTGVVMYRSTDLETWEYEGVILPCSKDPSNPLYGPLRFERPKIIYNAKTKKYVLWCHYVAYPGDHGFTDGTGDAGVAICDTINGTYTWLGYSRPIDSDGYVRDCTVFQDEDGSAYFVYDRQVGTRWDGPEIDRCIYIVQLDDTYTKFTSRYKRIQAAYWREAACLMKKDSFYYMITSDLTSWNFNQAKYFRSTDLFGDWEDMGDPCIEDTDHLTFHSQGTYILSLQDKPDTFLFMAERHNTDNFLHCSYIWLPICVHPDHTLTISYCESFSL